MRALWTAALMLAAASAQAAEDRGGAVDDRNQVERPFLYLVDPHGPAPRQVLAGYDLAFSSGAGAIRPVPGHLDQEGLVHAFSLEAGVASRLSIYGTAMIAQPIGHSDVGAVAVEAGARVLLTPPRDRRLRVMLQASLLREFGADLGAVGEVTASYDLGRVRLAAALHAEHIFAAGRDPLDVYAVAGASVRVARPLRLGLEYVGQDLEAAFDGAEAERGVRHYLGPDAALALLQHRVLITAGAAVQVARAPGLLARAGLTYVY